MTIYTTFIFLGKPGSGKGVQASLLSEKIGYRVVPLGKTFREIATHDTIIGHKVKDIIEKGHLMPYWFASHLFLNAVLNFENKEGAIFDGAARKKPEAVLFHDVMTWLERPYKAILVDVNDEVVMQRILKRKGIEGRNDDGEEALRVRLKEHSDEAEAAIEHFRSVGTLLEINGDQTEEEVHQEILRAIGLG